ncbi:MAG: class I mannose-6-phosphate isomerase [Rikenellaceae bacterium]|nr:class I mannose-6-phosphate isomerase [Rikenellaceae bacterium]
MLYPLKFTPRLKERIWGGTALAEVMGKELPEGKKIGESWEISGVDNDVSVVANGTLAGNDLQELIEVYMGDLVGDKVYNKYGLEFPLLIKFIDARDVLSIQVHPDDVLAKERHNSYGKTEMWYVLAADPGASLYVGFSRTVGREEYLAAVENGTLPSLLKEEKVRPGESYFIPAGTIHAIGKGLLVAEIQQTSDITYRVDDWGRVDDNGNPRQLHTELAVDAIDFRPPHDLKTSPVAVPNQAVEVEECEYFTTNLLKVEDSVERDYSNLDSFVVYICIEGELTVCYSGGSETLEKGETMLVPAQEDNIELDGEGTVLEVYIA